MGRKLKIRIPVPKLDYVQYESERVASETVNDHEMTVNPHPQYQRTVQKGVANGYAGLDAEGQVPVAQLGTGATATKFLRGDQTWADPPGGSANLDGGLPDSNYGGITNIDGGLV